MYVPQNAVFSVKTELVIQHYMFTKPWYKTFYENVKER